MQEQEGHANGSAEDRRNDRHHQVGPVACRRIGRQREAVQTAVEQQTAGKQEAEQAAKGGEQEQGEGEEPAHGRGQNRRETRSPKRMGSGSARALATQSLAGFPSRVSRQSSR